MRFFIKLRLVQKSQIETMGPRTKLKDRSIVYQRLGPPNAGQDPANANTTNPHKPCVLGADRAESAPKRGEKHPIRVATGLLAGNMGSELPGSYQNRAPGPENRVFPLQIGGKSIRRGIWGFPSGKRAGNAAVSLNSGIQWAVGQE